MAPIAAAQPLVEPIELKPWVTYESLEASVQTAPEVLPPATIEILEEFVAPFDAVSLWNDLSELQGDLQLLFLLYLRKMLAHLDPSKAVPKRVRSALDSLAEGLLVIDNNQRMVLANQSFASWVDREPEKLIGVYTQRSSIGSRTSTKIHLTSIHGSRRSGSKLHKPA